MFCCCIYHFLFGLGLLIPYHLSDETLTGIPLECRPTTGLKTGNANYPDYL